LSSFFTIAPVVSRITIFTAAALFGSKLRVTHGEIGETPALRFAIARTFGVTGAVTAVPTAVRPAELRARTATRSVEPRSLGLTTYVDAVDP
jgi:hypothetical protein